MEASAFLHRCVSLFIRDFRTSTAGFRMTRQRDDGAMKIGIALRWRRGMPMILAWNVRDLHKGTKVHQVSDEKLNQMKKFNSRFLAVGLGLALFCGLTNPPTAE